MAKIDKKEVPSIILFQTKYSLKTPPLNHGFSLSPVLTTSCLTPSTRVFSVRLQSSSIDRYRLVLPTPLPSQQGAACRLACCRSELGFSVDSLSIFQRRELTVCWRSRCT
ncbi:hypothetical protein ASPBRDRAFT_276808 [Aspergillus brasiliensis CBS 101740]|uniref:Uncharacterized protein n=1 Tax=Aspergillus brasiliensis (strain CBS 101740 / IMI 381727 / IBT 21946) TaxID=767769 RepID=A0A1L9UCK7_ASPBC|nr:hypothetical protein ASPBRDRAFT_276808 [Aspergillus brasiliensis CBS 101740]